MINSDFFSQSTNHLYFNELLNALHRIGIVRHLKKGEELLSSRLTSHYLFYIQEGGFKSFKLIDNREYIFGFALKGDFECDIHGMLYNGKSKYTFKAIMASSIILCKWDDLKEMLTREKSMLALNHILSMYIQVLHSRMIASQTSTAEERYKRMIIDHSERVNTIPLSDLASYLGITKQSLSRIRRNKFKLADEGDMR